MTDLLNKTNAPLQTLSMSRIQLDVTEPFCLLNTTEDEVLLYPLIGTVTLRSGPHAWGRIGTRQRMVTQGMLTDTALEIARFPAGQEYEILLQLDGNSADLLMISRSSTDPEKEAALAPMIHRHDTVTHAVGEGSHARTVRVIPTPPGYRIQAGETFNPPGHWSSWPAHATPQELERCADHEECFYVVTPGYAIMRMVGRFCTGESVRGVREIQNDEALVSPLGAHEIVAAPDAWLYYAFFYISYLEKRYNRWSHEGIKTYVK